MEGTVPKCVADVHVTACCSRSLHPLGISLFVHHVGTLLPVREWQTLVCRRGLRMPSLYNMFYVHESYVIHHMCHMCVQLQPSHSHTHFVRNIPLHEVCAWLTCTFDMLSRYVNGMRTSAVVDTSPPNTHMHTCTHKHMLCTHVPTHGHNHEHLHAHAPTCIHTNPYVYTKHTRVIIHVYQIYTCTWSCSRSFACRCTFTFTYTYTYYT